MSIDVVLEGSLLLVLLGGLAVHQVVETGAALHEVVETTHDAEDTEGENPDTDNSDNAGLASNEPTEDTEEGSKDIDDQDGARQLPRGDRRPERTVGTSDEDQPVLSKRDLEEENLIDLTKVLDNTTILRVGVHGGKGNPGTDSKNNTEENGHSPELRKVPLDRSLGEGSVVVGNGKGSNIGENGNEDDKLNVERSVQDSNPETEEDLHVQGKSDTVNNTALKMKDLARSLKSIDDSTETRSEENNIGGRTSGVRGTLNSNTSIGLLQRGSIVDTVTSHGNKVTTLLENLDDIVLVLGENFSETIGSLNEIVNLRTRHITTAAKTETLSVVDVGTETELTGSLTGNTNGVTISPVHRDGVVFLDSLEDEKWGTLDTDNTLALRGLNNSLDLLGDGIEGVEIEDLVLGQNTLGAGVELEGLEESLVDGIDTLLLARSGQAGSKHKIIRFNSGNTERLSKRELVLGQSTSLVRAKDLDTSKGLNGGQLLDDSLLLGEVCSTDSHGGGNDSGKTDRDTNDGDSENNKQSSDDQHEKNRSNAVENLSEVTSSTSGLRNKGSSTTNEGVVTSSSDDDESLTTLDSGRSVTVVTMVLVNGERLSSDGGLIDLAEASLGNETTIGGDDGSFLNLENITGNDLRGLNLLQGTVTEDNSLKGKSLLQFLDNTTSLILLSDEEHQKLQDHIFLFFFHCVQSPFATTSDNLSLSKTDARVGLELVLGNDTATAGLSLFFFIDLMAVLGLEVLDQGIHVLVGLLIFGNRSLVGVGGGSLSSLLIEAASLDVGVERRSADRLLFSHGGREEREFRFLGCVERDCRCAADIEK
ncbi:hypothetical protein HG530_011111 [Fusarium avenaceum]|nr:hypothetical protein HG530_011111 [Fusarium avenaceum]